MESQLNQTCPAHSALSSDSDENTRTNASAKPVVLLPLYGAVPALTVIALQFAASGFDPIRFFTNTHGSGGGHRPAQK